MSNPPSRADPGTGSRPDRLEHWSAALLSALLHLLLLGWAASSPPVTLQPPSGAAAGGARVEVTFINETPATAVAAPEPPTLPPDPASPPAAGSPLMAVPVADAEDPRASDPADGVAQPRQPRPARPAANPPPAPGRPAHVWGQPPGMLPEDHAPLNAGPARSPAIERGRRHDASSAGPNLEVGGFQVLYDLRSEARLRAWRDQGITELFIPLPGHRDYMVCPLETALRRESGACRLLNPDDPDLATIGDAREVITIQRVYRRGELLWRGPRPYR